MMKNVWVYSTYCTWSSTNNSVATVDSTVTISATVDGQIVSATVEVTSAETFAFTIDTSLGTTVK